MTDKYFVVTSVPKSLPYPELFCLRPAKSMIKSSILASRPRSFQIVTTSLAAEYHCVSLGRREPVLAWSISEVLVLTNVSGDALQRAYKRRSVAASSVAFNDSSLVAICWIASLWSDFPRP